MKFLKMFQEFRALDPELPLQTVFVFLMVAQAKDTLLQRELAERVDMSSSALSRSLSTLDRWSWLKRPGLNLVRSEPDLMDRRQRMLKLTKKGRALYHKLQKMEVDDSSRDTLVREFVAA